MAGGITIAALSSRAVRAKIGKRVVSQFYKPITIGSIVNVVAKSFGALNNFATGVLNGLNFTLTAAWGLIVRTGDFIYNFNWNTTDAAFKAQINSAWTALAGQLGGTLGNALGYLGGGVLPGLVVFKFNPVLGALILKNVLEDGLDELADNVKNLAFGVANLAVQVLFISTFTTVRKLIKSQSKIIGKLFGSKTEKLIKSWGEEGTAAWNWASEKEAEYDSIKSETWQNFWEEFDEEMYEGFVEAGFVVANTADTWIAEQKLQEMIAVENQKVIVVTPNRLVPEQKVILAGSGNDLRNQITSTLVTHQVMADRDVGIIYGTDNEQPVRSLMPEVILKFYQKKEDRVIGTGANGKPFSAPNPLTMQIGFRLMGKTEDDFETDIYAKQLAQRIYTEFATPPYKIDKNTNLFTYNDFRKGYALKIWVSDANTAKMVVKKVLDIQGHTMDDDKFRIGSKPTGAVKKSENKVILGKTVEVPNMGQKTGKVTFKEAILNVGNGTDTIVLVDLTGKRRNVVFKP